MYKHQNKWLIDQLSRINITDYVRVFLVELSKREERPVMKLGQKWEAERIKGLLNIAKNTSFKSFRDIQGIPHWDDQPVDYVHSNLGKGYSFYFRCTHCNRRVKYLYEYSLAAEPICRTCCRITYRRRKHSLLSKHQSPVYGEYKYID